MESHKEKILIVDDLPDNIYILNDLLKENYETYFATDGKTALNIVEQNIPDLILMDIMMPDLDGYEVCRRLKQDERTRDIPVIFISAIDEVSDAATGLEAGAIDYISKPISAPIVKARVHNHLELKHHRDTLAQLLKTDGLTGIANRHSFDEHLSQEWNLAMRNQWPISIIISNVDYFRSYNNSYGHLQGDTCLMQIAQAIRETLKRPTDFVARFDGEEFACILPDTNPNGALRVADNILKSTQNLKIPHKHSNVSQYITLSIGLSSHIPNQNSNPKQLLDAVDKGLYMAKNHGRNTSHFCKF